MRLLAIIALSASCAFGAYWKRGDQIIERPDAETNWAAKGFARVVPVTNRVEAVYVTNAIPPALVEAAALFKGKMEGIFGAGAVTNRSITRASVAGHFIAKRESGTFTANDAADALILDTLWGQLLASGLTAAPDETWTFPWGRSEVVTEIPAHDVVTWEARP